MDQSKGLSRVQALSDAALLLSLNGVLLASRRAVAEVVAHLGEVEQRRLHLLGGYASMFAYCVSRLGMSEDEAGRRIEVARLTRRFPLLFERLARGQVSLSVAALLKPYLTEANQVALLDAVSRKTIWQAREALATLYPRPDVLPTIRKLPVRREGGASAGFVAHDVRGLAASELASSTDGVATISAATSGNPSLVAPRDPSRMEHIATMPSAAMPSDAAASVEVPSTAMVSVAATSAGSTRSSGFVVRGICDDIEAQECDASSRSPIGPLRASMVPATTVRRSPSFEPLSPERYKVQLTATATLKRKLELARDLLRHAMPNGDLASIIERALDLLLEQTMKRRFATSASPPAVAPDRVVSDEGTAQRAPVRAGATTAADSPRIGRPGLCSEAPVHAPPDTRRALLPERPPLQPMMPVPNVGSSKVGRVEESDRGKSANARHEPAGSEPAGSQTAKAALAEAPLAEVPLAEAPLAEGSNAARSEPSDEVMPPTAARRRRRIPSAVRRAVLARDGARCTWVGPDGTRCNSQAWLEHDHVTPRGQGGKDEASNIRIRCRAHNRLAAEHAYGQGNITRIIADRRSARAARSVRARAP